jgi:hypothetical protein
MGKSATDATAIEVDDAIMLAAGKDHTTAEGILALPTDQAGL